MLHARILTKNWALGLMVSLVLLFIYHTVGFSPLDKLLYDWRINKMAFLPTDRVAVIAIDDKTLNHLGDWARSYRMYAQLIDLIAPHAKTIGSTLTLASEEHDFNYQYIDELATFYTSAESLTAISQQLEQLDRLVTQLETVRTRTPSEQARLYQLLTFYHSSQFTQTLSKTLTNLEDKLYASQFEFKNHAMFAHSLQQANNVFLGIPFRLGHPHETIAPKLPNYLRFPPIHIETFHPLASLTPLIGVNTTLPLAIFGQHARGVSYFNLNNSQLDSRQLPLLIQYNGDYLPTLPLQLLAHYLHANKISVKNNQTLVLNKLILKTSKNLTILPFFYTKEKITVDSAIDVLTGQINPKKYQDKIVLIGSSSTYDNLLHNTPIGNLSSVMVLAHSLSSLLNAQFFIEPYWTWLVKIGYFTIALLYICVILPYLRQPIAILMTIGLLLLFVTSYIQFLQQGYMISVVLALLVITCGQLLLFIKRIAIAYQDAFRLHPNAVESNRLLGLAFQGQGQLDIAFEKFRLCPPNSGIIQLIYNLALDYELKRQHRQAAAVYRYILHHMPHFRDTQQRLAYLMQLQKPRLRSIRSLAWFSSDAEKIMLGRYIIERRLGKGAMGTVYLGKDQKLDRQVAIKTLDLSQETLLDRVQDIITRFFREASAAGRLKHPNIVSIYDAGEEHSLAYICMEFFKGGNLTPYTHAENLLPTETVLNIIGLAAEALDYAHRQGVIHRDIKPANIMYNPASNHIKITDFGIAHIADTHKTRTGVILGTPSYMSPEQLAGKQLDGRTDLFSLGITLYQLLTGELPFQANSMATLMFKIANENHPNITYIRPNISPCLEHVVNTALQKDRVARFQTGAEFAQALYNCMSED